MTVQTVNTVAFTLNGVRREAAFAAGETALALLRRLNVLTVKDGCTGEGTCGLCAVLLDGKLVNTCHLLPWQLEGRDVRTSESLSRGPNLDAISRRSRVRHRPAAIARRRLATVELMKTAVPTRAQIRDAFGHPLPLHGTSSLRTIDLAAAPRPEALSPTSSLRRPRHVGSSA
jgi:hypothetical protein